MTNFHSPLFVRPGVRIMSRGERRKRGIPGAIADAFMLDTSIGQATMMAATTNAMGIPWSSANREVVEGYNPFDGDELVGYEQYYDEFITSMSPKETMLIKQMIDNNRDLRENIEDFGITRFISGFLDPINLIPIPFAIGKGFVGGFKSAFLRGAPIVGITEVARHKIDPTSRIDETMFAVLGGSLFMGLMGGAVGRIDKAAAMTVSQALQRLSPPPGTTSMFAGVPFFLGRSKQVFKQFTRSIKNTANQGETLAKGIDPDSIIVREPSAEGDEVKLVEFHHSDTNILSVQIAKGVMKVLAIEVPKHLQKQGIGTAVYKRAIKYAEDNGLKFVSDTEVSKPAARLWATLEDEGFVIHENKNIEFDETGTRFTTDKEPAFEVRPQIDPDAEKIPLEVREELAEIETTGKVIRGRLKLVELELKQLRKKLKIMPKKGGHRTKTRNKIAQKQEVRDILAFAARENRSRFLDRNVQVAQMLDDATIKDWDLLPTGYNKLLGKLDQFPWWVLMKTPLRQTAPEIATKLQLYALRMASTPGLNNLGNKLGATSGSSVESLAILWTGKFLAVKKKSDALYRKYLGHGESSGQLKTFIIDSTQRVRATAKRFSGKERPTTTSSGKLTIEEWENQITRAINKGGEHKIPEIAEAATGYTKALKEMGDKGRELGIFANQINMKRKLDYTLNEILNLEAKFDGSPPAGVRTMIDELQLEAENIRSMQAAYLAADSSEFGGKGFIHRMWLADEVRAKEVELKEYLTQEFTKNPKEGKTTIRMDDEIVVIDNLDPEAIEGRVNEAYASILREAQLGGDADFMIKSTNKRDWLEARKILMESDEPGVTKTVAAVQLESIERKLGRIRDGAQIVSGSGPLLSRRLDLDDAVLLDMGVIESNVTQWMNHYVQRLAPVIETATKFGDGHARTHINEIISDIYIRAADELDPKIRASLEKEAGRAMVAMNDLRDIVHGVWQIPDNPASITARTLRLLRNFNILGAMGRSVMMAIGDIGNVVVSQGFIRTFQHAFESFGAGVTDGKIKMMRDEVELAGSVSEVILGMRYHQLTELGPQTGAMTKFERAVAGASQRFFLLNLLGPWTDMARRFSGGMLQSKLIQFSIMWKAGKLDDENIKIMGRLGINKAQAEQFAEEWSESGKLKHGEMFIAQTEQWVSEEAQRTFRAALNTEINRMVPTPGAVDKPKGLLKSEWWKVIGQYRGFSIAATHRIMGAGIHTKGADKWIGMASMVGIAAMVDMLKRPDYIKMPIEEQMLRAVELSAVTGIILDFNDTLERASAGAAGIRPLLGMGIRERNPNWANRMGTIGAVPNQWLMLMYGLFADDADNDDLARGIRYMIPYNNLLWWNGAFNRAQRSTVDFLEDD